MQFFQFSHPHSLQLHIPNKTTTTCLENPGGARRVQFISRKRIQYLWDVFSADLVVKHLLPKWFFKYHLFPGIPTTIKTMGVNITTIDYLRVLNYFNGGGSPGFRNFKTPLKFHNFHLQSLYRDYTIFGEEKKVII